MSEEHRARLSEEASNRWMVVLTGALVLFAAVQVVVTALTLQGLRHSKLAAEAAGDAAKAARLQAEIAERTMIGLQRPSLRVRISPLIRFLPKKGSRLSEFQAEITIANKGKEPATIVDFAAQFAPYVAEIRTPIPGVHDFDSVWSDTGAEDGQIIDAGELAVFTISRLMDPELGEIVENFWGLNGVLYIYGLIVYDDPLGFRRTLGFTQGWAKDENEFVRCTFEGCHFDRTVEPDSNPIRRKLPERRQ